MDKMLHQILPHFPHKMSIQQSKFLRFNTIHIKQALNLSSNRKCTEHVKLS
jgi:hypothetical protein